MANSIVCSRKTQRNGKLLLGLIGLPVALHFLGSTNQIHSPSLVLTLFVKRSLYSCSSSCYSGSPLTVTGLERIWVRIGNSSCNGHRVVSHRKTPNEDL